MFERLKPLKNHASTLLARLVCHRALYGGLAACHGTACLITEKPALYAAMAALYTLLAWRK